MECTFLTLSITASFPAFNKYVQRVVSDALSDGAYDDRIAEWWPDGRCHLSHKPVADSLTGT